MKTRSMYKAERMSLDRISSLPEPILETILCFLPTKDAARTSILSREWRYKWTRIPKLELFHRMECPFVSEETSIRNENTRCESCYDIQQILLLRQGPIHELTFRFPDDEYLEIDRMIRQLSRTHPIKKLTLYGSRIDWSNIPFPVFSLRNLTELYVYEFDIDHPLMFNGFGSLEILYLRDVRISKKTLLHLLINCPLLERLSMLIRENDEKCTICELFKCLPMIEHLTINANDDRFEWLALDSVPQELPTSLVNLKYFCLEDVLLREGYVIVFLLLLIKCAPNLKKIVIQSDAEFIIVKPSVAVWEEVWEKYTHVWLEHLNELYIGWFDNTKHEIEFVKFILARSPKLKKVTIYSRNDKDQESKMLETLLQAPRVSQVVINVNSSGISASPSNSTR